MFNFTKKLFWIIAFFIIVANAFGTYYLYKQTQELILERADEKAMMLKNYFYSMRYVYHQQFLNSKLELNENTLGFLPAHASTLISDFFSKQMPDSTTIRNVSDQPRNSSNRADSFETQSMRYFIQNPQASSQTQLIKQNNKEYYFYTAPLFIEPYCLACHGSKDEVLPYISKKYDTAYDYKVGDVRGVTSIKIPMEEVSKNSWRIFYEDALFSWSLTLSLLVLIYLIVSKLTRKEADAKAALQKEVYKKTASLHEANKQQKHLFSILRTVADCNQVLITSNSMDEHIEQTSHIMFAYKAFDGIKIIIVEDEQLLVKSSLGLDEERDILSLEAEVFQNNRELMLDEFSENLPDKFLNKVKRHNIQASYIVPLINQINAHKALGVLSICTKTVEGFTKEEKNMIRELAGDIGFAINSYIQKEQIQRLSHYNQLTNLPNKRLLLMHLEKLLGTVKEKRVYHALLYIDIDNFKMVNDFKGVSVGDTLLQKISERFLSILNMQDEIYHVGGDKFVLLINNLDFNLEKSTLFTQDRAEELLNLLSEPFLIDSQNIYVTLSIGITLFESKERASNELINSAESAMMLSKNAGKNRIRFYDAVSQTVAVERSSMLQDLRSALLEEQFFMLYQKQLNEQGETLGVEALVRWQHPTLGLISPANFIPLAEESGLIVKLGAWIFKKSVEQMALWSKESEKQGWKISINVSPLQFNDAEFISLVNNIVQNAKVAHSSIRIELTEGIFIRDIDEVNAKIVALKELGFSISIDDFGTGYSSLSYLKNLPIDELKIDQSFVKNLTRGSSDETIIKTIIAMGDAFGLEVIAEGVETEQQLALLKSLGCKRFQGYLFALPKKADEL